MPRSPVRAPTRVGHLAAGLLSTVLLAITVAGIPVALATIGGNPLPHHVPTWSAISDGLLHKDVSGALFIRALDIVGWLAWASFALSVVLEVVARVRRRRTMRVPGLAAPQRWAAGLVAAVALTFASPAVANASAHPIRVPAAVAVAGPLAGAPLSALRANGPVHVVVPARALPQADQTSAPLVYQVRPGDYLGAIAERFGGSFGGAAQIARHNHIADPDKIDVGWHITLPAGAHDTGPRAHATGRVVGPSSTTDPQHGTGSSHPGTRGHAPSTQAPPPAHPGGTTPGAPTHGATAPGATTTPANGGRPVAGGLPGSHPAHPVPAPASSSVGGTIVEMLEASGTLAAVVSLALVVIRRREQLQHRLARNTDVLGASGGLTPRLMAATRTEDVVRLDDALRVLADQVQDWPVEDIPQVAGVWLDQGAITLLLADDSGRAPRPFRDDPNGWLLAADEPLSAADDQLAPLPALCTVGGRAGQHVLLDLEYLRVLGIGGDEAEAMNLLRFIAAELCHNVWSDDVRVTIAGFGADSGALAGIDAGRIRIRASVAQAIDAFSAQLADAVANLDDVRTPEVLLVAHPTAGDHEALLELEREMMRAPGVGMSVVVAPTPEGLSVGRYQMAVGAAGDLHVGFLGDAIMPAASLPSMLVTQVGALIAAARATGDNSPLDLARAASLAMHAAAPGTRSPRLAGQHRQDGTPGRRSFRRELEDLTRPRHVRPAGFGWNS